MTRITIDADLGAKLKSLGTVVELCDNAGNVFGRFVPLVDLAEWEPVTPEASEEELDRREQEDVWYSFDEVMAHLRKLENQ